MAHHQSAVEIVVGAALAIGMMLVTWAASQQSIDRLEDPSDDRTLFLDQLPAKALIARHGRYDVTIYRQSGNVHSQKTVFGTADDALKVVLATFRRAKIDAVNVRKNEWLGMTVARLWHDHRGSAEGKKVGHAVITVLEDHTLANSKIDIKLSTTCPCGSPVDVQFDNIEAEHPCPACGDAVVLTDDKIEKIRAAHRSLSEEALARLMAGERIVNVTTKVKDDDATLS